MPSFYNGCDWVAVAGSPPDLEFVSGLKRGGLVVPKFDEYKIVVLQQVAGTQWLHRILNLKRKGVRVLYEIDDHIHSVRKMKGHAAREHYSKRRLIEYEKCMRACDGIIVSTEFLRRDYRKFNERVWVCRNSIEAGRYSQFELPPRQDDKIHIGWAGGEGHQESVKRWLPAVQRIMDEREDVRFVTIGLPFANEIHAPGRTVALPFVPIENVPSVMCNMDIGIAPAGRGHFFKAKSDLRFLEAGALGIPLVADSFVYDDIRHNETGFLAESQEDVYLGLKWMVEDRHKREFLGSSAREYILTERCIEKEAEQWVNVFMEVA
jgi:glycosyltransferase involved in cell wall biosynthesis